ncbi:CsbD family protein [Paraburkholderia acidipaludis]|uniref:CsbD family protein n=1 Tax=Paraburkholderia acidipaludis TaxID=660537 RepID=UPI000483D7AE|nr:CsbD family protein [Paraburkholderia acidipaludis]
MDNDRIKGAAKEIKGSIKEATGKITGNRETELEGKVEKATGTVQRNIGEAKDKVRDKLEKED